MKKYLLFLVLLSIVGCSSPKVDKSPWELWADFQSIKRPNYQTCVCPHCDALLNDHGSALNGKPYYNGMRAYCIYCHRAFIWKIWDIGETFE